MGDIAEMALNGTMCQCCGELMDFDDPCGFPVMCGSCEDESSEDDDGADEDEKIYPLSFVDEHVICDVTIIVDSIIKFDKELNDLNQSDFPKSTSEIINKIFTRQFHHEWLIITDDLYYRLEALEEPVIYDFFGLTLWGRPSKDIAIEDDTAIIAIVADLNSPPDETDAELIKRRLETDGKIKISKFTT